ncbi:hypothetical protein EX895_002438 [Sporisorium graminicola]|uniref:Uncharacterized protein n=1 Tax=Sporisorium graminicola TaxID=280036 RepID=A0A4U7KX58_9BASI|nr:hypothetical protein EX895_002438 [Sporisorium graminicola]TKY88807.1 hypothetical protein EX895_002438 [Sporisorium graminicola]
MSLVEGEPFYTRIASSDNSSSANSKATFRSSQLWRALQLLSTQASRSTSSNEPVSIEELIEALQLNHTSVVSVPNKHPALKTTLRDVQHLLQTLLGNHHNVLPSLPAVGLDSLGVRNYFSPYALATDGVMASTHSGLTLVRQGTSSHGALRAVGTHGFAMSLQQWNRKLDTLFLVEVEDGKELTIAINLERGLTSIILTDLIESTAAENEGEDKTTSMGEWIRIWFGNAVLLFDWAHEDWMDQNWAGTYRYQRHAEDAEGTQFNWIEVDVQIDERVPWITRIEYSAYPNDTSSRTTSSPSTSVLKKYNVGGTSDFLAGWTCQLSPESLSRCYRPLVGDDEGHCRCRGYRRDGKTISHNRVGLWPSKTRKLDGGRMWTIPQGTIRRDGSSYMDQGLGGCHALWKFDAEQTVPEMQHLGYHVQFVEGKDQLKWLLPGLVMDRVRK